MRGLRWVAGGFFLLLIAAVLFLVLRLGGQERYVPASEAGTLELASSIQEEISEALEPAEVVDASGNFTKNEMVVHKRFCTQLKDTQLDTNQIEWFAEKTFEVKPGDRSLRYLEPTLNHFLNQGWTGGEKDGFRWAPLKKDGFSLIFTEMTQANENSGSTLLIALKSPCTAA